jgi:hypothetical protein
MQTEDAAETTIAVGKSRLGPSCGRDEATLATRGECLVTGVLEVEGPLPWFAGHVWAEA